MYVCNKYTTFNNSKRKQDFEWRLKITIKYNIRHVQMSKESQVEDYTPNK